MLKWQKSKLKKLSIKPLTFVTASRSWNDIIEDCYNKCLSLDINFIWINHLDSHNGDTSFKITSQSKNLIVLNCYSSDNYLEKFLFKALNFLNLDTWYFLIADDEFISRNSISKLKAISPGLDENFVYRCNRIWVQDLRGEFFYSSLATQIGQKFDYQYRLFNLKHLKPNELIHTPGFIVRKFKTLSEDVNILHLPWLLESFEQRVAKVKKYEEISPGAGIGKLRYYLPELFPEKQHSWKRISDELSLELKQLL